MDFGQPQQDGPQDVDSQSSPQDFAPQGFAPQGGNPSPDNSHGGDDLGPNFGPSTGNGGGGRGGNPGAGNPFSQPGNPGRETYQRQYDTTNGNGTSQGSMQEHLNQALAKAVRDAGGRSASGYEDPKLCALAVPYVHKLAKQGKQDGHAGFSEVRAPKLAKTVGGQASEITAESYPGSGDVRKQAKECVEGWLGSNGHRKSMMSSHGHYCYAAAYSRSTKRTFCVGLFVE